MASKKWIGTAHVAPSYGGRCTVSVKDGNEQWGLDGLHNLDDAQRLAADLNELETLRDDRRSMDRVTPKLKWRKSEGKLADCLVEPERNHFFDLHIAHMTEANMSLIEIIKKLDEPGDISVEEWIAIAFALGYFAAQYGE